ncbi:hypothetical protein V5O48_008931, partial [Marasmius crinis-equi]
MSLNIANDNVDTAANSANSNNTSLSPARAPPSPPDSPKYRSNTSNTASCTSPRVSLSPSSASIQPLHTAPVPPSSTLQQHNPATLDAAISTVLPSSPSSRSTASYRSASVSPNPMAALHRATRRDQDASDASIEAGSDISAGDVAEARGLMRSLGFGSPISSPPPGVNRTQSTCLSFFNYLLHDDCQLTMCIRCSLPDVSLEDGEIREDAARQSNTAATAMARSPGSASLFSTSAVSRSPRQVRHSTQRLRNESQNGSAIPSSPEVMPTILPGKDLDSLPGYRHGSLMLNSSPYDVDSSQSNTPVGNLTPVPIPTTAGSQKVNGQNVDATGSSATPMAASISTSSVMSSLPSATSTLSSLSSTSSFHTASSSTTSIPTLASTSVSSVADQALCAPQHQQASPVPMQSQIVVSESGTIQLPPPGAPASGSSTLNPRAAEHIPGSNVASGLAPSESTLSDGFSSDQNKTSNVYINGLPPHYPEDQLFELAAPFGEIRSVRSFTRHVGEKESGYGFVLFETVEAAEKCIQTLRKFRNLHPTFSKQVHKIPGIPFTQQEDDDKSQPDTAPAGAMLSNATSEPVTFKNKMERLADPGSTNLYIEGLPLSIDEP